jgi:hypothetical protein
MEDTSKALGIPMWALAVLMGIFYIAMLLIGLFIIICARWIFEQTCQDLEDSPIERRQHIFSVSLFFIFVTKILFVLNANLIKKSHQKLCKRLKGHLLMTSRP